MPQEERNGPTGVVKGRGPPGRGYLITEFFCSKARAIPVGVEFLVASEFVGFSPGVDPADHGLKRGIAFAALVIRERETPDGAL